MPARRRYAGEHPEQGEANGSEDNTHKGGRTLGAHVQGKSPTLGKKRPRVVLARATTH